MQLNLSSWSIDWFVLIVALASIYIYVRGWRGLHRRQPALFSTARLISFVAGVCVLLVAIFSPLDTLSGLLLQAHMAQHILLMMVAPPLILLGLPALPLLCGLPATVQKYWLGPFLSSPACKRVASTLVHPISALAIFVIVTWLWHVPALYQLALDDSSWHVFEHSSFLTASILFWFPIINPYPYEAKYPRWLIIPYLLIADIQNSLLSAIFCFATNPLYTFYPNIKLFGFSKLEDQAAAGAMMWVASSIAFLIPAAVILKSLLTNREAIEKKTKPVTIPLPLLQSTPPTWIYSMRLKRCVQIIMLLISIAVIIDGLLGPRLAPLNLAGILPWIYWRGLVIIAILVVGNLFCWACPFMLVRELGKRLPFKRKPWPHALKNKWAAVCLFVLWLWMYETFDPWNSTVFTSWIIIGYFAAALIIDSIFKGASFCKWVCPIGQFHFVASMISPSEVTAKDEQVCNACTTQDCIKGGEQGRGCELDLFLPTKQGNLDCTFCLDCVRACPHDNASLKQVFPTIDLLQSDFRGSIRSVNRNDLTALMLVIVFGAFANAAGMIAPVQQAIGSFSNWLGGPSLSLSTSMFIFATLVVLPTWCFMITKRISKTQNQVAWTLLPLGVSMWAAHLLFHFFASSASLVPVAQRAVSNLGLMATPSEFLAFSATPNWLLHGEIFCLAIGLLASIALCLQLTQTPRSFLPWCILNCSLFVVGVYVLLQPMQMRGTMG